MYSFSSFASNELMEKYKRQVYLVAFLIGLPFSVLYMRTFAGSGLQFYITGVIFLELLVFIFLILFMPPLKYAMEIVFYLLTPICFFILMQIRVDFSMANSQNQITLGDPVYSLCMWLIVFLIGAFLSLKPAHVRVFILLMFAGMTIMAVNNLWALYLSNKLMLAFVFRWVNAFVCSGVATLLIHQIGLFLQRNATTDALTGMLNRHALYPILTRELDRSVRYARSFSIILFDIDKFKVLNDTFGHLEGDEALKELSKLVGNLLRKADSAGRWGGEEFLLILPETDIAAAQVLAERVRVMIEETHFAGKYHITASFGVAAYRTGQSLESLLECADIALYQAKNNGRNQVGIFQQKLDGSKN